MCICCLFTTHLSLVILGLISAARSESWYQKLEFCFTSFWFYYHRLWWSSWHVMLALFLLYAFLVWIFSWRDLFQVTGTDPSCVLYIICFQFITFEVVTLFCLLRLVCCIVVIALCRFASHLPFFVFASIW